MALARRVRTIIRAILGFAEERGRVECNVALSNIEELKIRHVVTSNPAIERIWLHSIEQWGMEQANPGR
ncbi:prophage integrase protein [Pseudomonas synxantha]|uniref:Prophage integrase protein n=1 Tax=Pseudomonas synxantha TaxID=47883 RepID=A0AAX3IDJ6_9PSED|nr:prophage integrase protein [Pseudomonas synxantha]